MAAAAAAAAHDDDGLSPSAFAVTLAAGCVARLSVQMQRYALPPTLRHPWDAAPAAASGPKL
jgi:hypothetical protein|eukprot:COSAG01_NODE_11617_length_1893_cov_31.678715_3_plen_62_part_00